MDIAGGCGLADCDAGAEAWGSARLALERGCGDGVLARCGNDDI